ncbi:hypothetical protein SAMN05444392_11371 [Seinonella peptonophila]|uniref:AAA domain-containing protein n=1 Tax=Seinonella peptonophila TaxID=112248 RepID=A0A1M5AF66_9BACL|nr:hypothetical protein [Seinonella peptonophila]SHF28787.1 hypothetical protein SAMN05444392_11371 [Seinonella peptonophila]
MNITFGAVKSGGYKIKKICIIGLSGTGKSTLAMKLGAVLKIKVYHLDALYWKPGWVQSTMDELMDKQKEILKKECWIIDGNYSDTWSNRLDEADLIIYLDIPRCLRMYRLLKDT